MESVDTLRRATGATACLACGKCSSLCPLAPFGAFSPARAVSSGPSGEPTPHARGAAARCLTCGLCELRCPEGVRFLDFIRGFRQETPLPQRAPCPHGAALLGAARLMAAAPPRRSRRWLGDDLRVAEEGETALFVGCLPLFDVLFERRLGIRPTDIAAAAVRLLNSLGIEPVVADDERCCGHDLRWSGDEESFRTLAAANAAAFQARGVRRILTVCAECCRTWRLDYAEAAPGYRPRVEHLTEFLAARLDSGEIRWRADGEPRVTFHDPCRLGRHLGVYDPPRQVLGSIPGVDMREMTASRRDAVCCGTTGFIHCDAASRALQAGRLASAAATGAETLVTACPKCFIHFTCAQAGDRRRGATSPAVVVRDFTLFVSDRIEAGPDAAPPAAGEEIGGAI